MCSLFFCYGDEENVRCACTYVHLTTANQSEICGNSSRLCYGDEENVRCMRISSLL